MATLGPPATGPTVATDVGGSRHPARLALVGARLFDGDGLRAVPRPAVVLEDGRIAAVLGSAELPAQVPVVDLGDVTLLPGLVDSHVHLGFDGSDDPVGHLCAADDDVLEQRMRAAAAQALAAGVTTVRDLGDRSFLALRVREWFRAGTENGPEILASGPPLTVPGGHCHFMGGEASGEEALRRRVRERADAGVDVVKIMVTGGILTQGTGPYGVAFTPAELQAVVDEAHAAGLPVAAHAHGLDGIAAAVDAGVDGLEHCGFWVPDGVDADPRLVARIAAAGIAVCPTLGIVPGSPDPPPPVQARWPLMEKVWGLLHAAGVRLLAGTDGGIATAKPHGATAYAVAGLHQVGLSPVEALRAATSSAAAACGLAGRKGVLAPGADADVIAVEGDPLADLDCLTRVRAVVRAGVMVRPPAT